MPLRVQKSVSGAAMEAFLALPARVYGRNPDYLPTPAATTRRELLRPEFSSRQAVFTVLDDDAPVARAVARVSPALRDERGRPLGMIGFHESLLHPDASRLLFDHATGWLRAAGTARAVGPMDGDTWHKYRLNLGPAEPCPFLMEPYNAAYYPLLWEEAGFTPCETYYSKVVDDPAAAARETARVAERAVRRFTLRPLDRRRLPEELAVLHCLSVRIFAANRLFTDLPLDEFRALYRGAGALLSDGLCWFACDPEGRDVGFVFAFPDRFEAVRSLRTHPGPVGWLRFLLLQHRADAVNIKTLGVLPEHQGTGIALALMHRVYANAAAAGFRRVNLCLIRDGNASGRMDGGLGRELRRYALYGKDLG
jgi:GNAT superfamily N-acetyltransferase